MWEPMTQALGYPKKKIGFDDILELARSDQGWAAYGRPEFGSFKLVHTNPDFSTAGCPRWSPSTTRRPARGRACARRT